MAIERSPVAGKCLAGWHNYVALIDPSAPVVSGDLARVVIDYADGRVASVIKLIETDSQNRWWISCDDGALQIGHFIAPRAVQKVIGREPSPISLDHVPVMQPSDHTLAVAAQCLAELRADQAANGRRLGVAFPAAELTHPKPFGRVPETMHATLPDSDLQQPGTPENFEVETIASTIQFWWTEPEVWPLESRYQIYAAPWSLSDIASKELIWEGSDQGKSLTFSATSQWYFQIRAQHGNFHSSFVPNTYGIPALPQLAEPWSSGMWLFSTSPGFVAKLSSESTLITPPITGVIVNTAGTPVFSWTNPSSINVRINSPGAASTTFTGSGMSVEEVRQGYFFCNVSDAGNISSKSAHVYIERWSGDS